MVKAKKVFSDRSKKGGRGRAQKSLNLIKAMYDIAEACEPITGRGIGYKLFSQGLIPSMSKNAMQSVYRFLREAREEGTIPWEWIVDETRGIEQVATWDDPDDYMRAVGRSYRRDFWQQQPKRIQVWSEKGTVRGVLKPVLDEYGVGFNPVHGFNSATNMNDAARNTDSDYPLIILYIGDYDPSGMNMSEHDLPKRLKEYGGNHITVKRIALLRKDCEALGREPAFNVREKSKDTRAPWFRKNYGQLCWELDAMDPNKLRERVEREIKKHIEPVAWARCQTVFAAETDSMSVFFRTYKGPKAY